MDPCPFVRLTVGNLALKVPVPAKPARTVIHPTSSPCFCKIKLKGFPVQTAVIPYNPSETTVSDGNHHPQTGFIAAATFHLSKDDLNKLAGKSIFVGKLFLKISIFTGRTGATCGVKNSGRLLGKVSVPLDLKGAESRAVVFHNGWTSVGKESGVSQFHVNVRADPDPRFVFQFDGEPECSPQVFQIKGNIRQPVFTCNFSFRSTNSDRHQRSRSSEQGSGRGWLSSFGSERERPGKERKGWSITVHDLSGSPVAAASMVTPFVASPGSDRVSRSNPGSWLILRPGEGTWKPWGRLEAWRERGAHDGLGYRFELIPDMSANSGVVLAESTLNTAKGGTFTIDLGGCNQVNAGSNGNGSNRGNQRSSSPGCSPRRGSGDFGMGLWPYSAYRGFVMAARVEGEGKCSKPTVEVSVQHVTCTEDAAAYVALAAAVDLSIDACRLFSQKLRKELCHTNDMGS
ncbi:uncharacterized protein LOC110693798 [Chenopodium quinoa]|uniref:uncharacterized protein LOC110693798 n=1 Tax=Chenopodium quinoa TaxID=63459 RepID=UPI000B77EF88|nr:uncharacterized protein LOC110693798 [Chenopodium quinoa]